MNRWWMSWYCYDEDYRPLTFPPNGAILGWWCSGYGVYHDRDASIICSMVEANTEHEAWEAVSKDWPGVDQRFCQVQEKDAAVLSDRFPLSDWMIPRFKGTLKY